VVTPDPRLRRNYAAAFSRFLFQPDEAALSAAYELGRQSLASGVSLLDIVLIHHDVVIETLSGIEGPQELAHSAATFLVEVLAPFDMTQRAFLEQRDVDDTAD